MDRFELGWVVGIIEGEGSFVCSWRISKEGLKYGIGRIQVNMTDEDAVRRVHNILKVGIIIGPRFHKNPKFKPYWSWSIYRRKDNIRVAEMLLPHMCSRRKQQIDNMLEKLSLVGRPLKGHGTTACYARGCRCFLCGEANNKKGTENRRKRGIPERKLKDKSHDA